MIRRIFVIGASFAAVLFFINAGLEFGWYQRDYAQGVLAKNAASRNVIANRKRAVLKRGYEFDSRKEYPFIEEVRKTEPTFIKSQCAGDFQTDFFNKRSYLPLGGTSNAVTLAGKGNGQFLTYLSDRYGFRNPDKEWDNASSSLGTDVILLGAGQEQGLVVNSDQSIAGVLRGSGLNVMNLACNGNAPAKALATLREYGQDLRAKYVVYVFGGTHYLELLGQELQHPILAKYLDDQNFTQNLKSNQDRVDKDVQKNFDIWFASILNERRRQAFLQSRDSWVRRLLTGRHIRTFIREWWANFTSVRSISVEMAALQENVIAFSQILKEMKQISQNMGAKFVFVFTPDIRILYNVEKRNLDQPFVSKFDFKSQIIKTAHETSLETIDLERTLRQVQPVDKLFDLGGREELGVIPAYYGSYAYRVIAESLIDELDIKQRK